MASVICVAWLTEDGLTDFVDHSIPDNYDGVVPVVGDKLVMVFAEPGKPGKVDDAVEVIDRYCVFDAKGDPYWHIIVKHIQLPESYAVAFARERMEFETPSP